MRSRYRNMLGREYEEPHGCLKLAEQVYREVYEIDVPKMDEGVPANNGRALLALLTSQTEEVSTPEEGDLVLIRSTPWHIGVYIGQGEIIHAYRGGTSCIQGLNEPWFRHRVEGYYRFNP